MRNTWGAYMVDIETGRIEWTLGGKKLELQVRPGRRLRVAARRGAAAGLDGQPVRRPLLPADRRRHLRRPDRTISSTRAQARPAGAHGDARLPVHPWRRLRRGLHGRRAAAAERQRVRRLGIGTLLLRVQPIRPAAVRRGTARARTSPTGRRWSSGSASRSPRPWAPSRQAGGKTTVYASWNGATEVASWRVLAGPSAGRRTVVATAAKSGFETAIPVHSERRELHGPGARCPRPGDRGFPPVHAVGRRLSRRRPGSAWPGRSRRDAGRVAWDGWPGGARRRRPHA